MTIKIGLHGATGRMGQEVLAVAPEVISYQYAPELDSNLIELALKSEVIIDFSVPNALPALLEQALVHKVPLVIGTTGLSHDHSIMIKQASTTIPILYAANMSLGVVFVKKMIITLLNLAQDFDIQILEMHHRHKKDQPSGTALMLKQLINSLIPAQEIPCFSIRAGGIPGEHQVIFNNDYETINITHRVHNRQVFAIGALKAASWLKDQPVGLYNIEQIVE